MITHSRNRQLIRRAIDALQPVADEHQAVLNLPAPHAPDAKFIGQLLSIGRTTDTLEDVISTLHALLDHPPSVGGAGSPRPLPRPVRSVDRITESGVAVPATSNGGPAAA